MMSIVYLIINPMEVFGAYLLYHKFMEKRASFRFQRVMQLIVLGIIIGTGYIYGDSDIVRSIVFLLLSITIFKVSKLRWSSSFVLCVLNISLFLLLQLLTAVVVFLPIKEFYIMALLGDSLYLLLVILIYRKIPISKLFRLTEQNLVIKLICFILCAGFYISYIVIGFNAVLVSPYILHYMVILLPIGVMGTVILIRKYTSEMPAKYHEHDNLIAGLVSLYMVYGNEELQENVSRFLEGFGKKEYADNLSVTLENKKDFLAAFLKCKQDNVLNDDINIVCDITYIDNEHVSKTDTIKIIGIMLDNAIEHCNRGEQVFLDVLIAEHIFDVEVKNPYHGSANDVGQMFQKGYSSKTEGTGGHGLDNLWQIVSQFNGRVMVQPLGKSITFKVVI